MSNGVDVIYTHAAGRMFWALLPLLWSGRTIRSSCPPCVCVFSDNSWWHNAVYLASVAPSGRSSSFLLLISFFSSFGFLFNTDSLVLAVLTLQRQDRNQTGFLQTRQLHWWSWIFFKWCKTLVYVWTRFVLFCTFFLRCLCLNVLSAVWKDKMTITLLLNSHLSHCFYHSCSFWDWSVIQPEVH